MGGSQSNPTPPRPKSQRRWSKEYPPSFALKRSEYNKLHQGIIKLLKTYEDKKEVLAQVIDELQNIINQIEQIEAKRNTGETAGAATLAVGGILAIAAVPLTGGASLAALGLGAAAGVAGTATNIGVKATHNKETNETQEKRKSEEARFMFVYEFYLEPHMNNVQRISEELRQTEWDVYEREGLLKLENHILTFKLNFLKQQKQIREGSISEAIDEMKQTGTRLTRLINVLETVLKRLDTKFKN